MTNKPLNTIVMSDLGAFTDSTFQSNEYGNWCYHSGNYYVAKAYYSGTTSYVEVWKTANPATNPNTWTRVYQDARTQSYSLVAASVFMKWWGSNMTVVGTFGSVSPHQNNNPAVIAQSSNGSSWTTAYGWYNDIQSSYQPATDFYTTSAGSWLHTSFILSGNTYCAQIPIGSNGSAWGNGYIWKTGNGQACYPSLRGYVQSNRYWMFYNGYAQEFEMFDTVSPTWWSGYSTGVSITNGPQNQQTFLYQTPSGNLLLVASQSVWLYYLGNWSNFVTAGGSNVYFSFAMKPESETLDYIALDNGSGNSTIYKVYPNGGILGIASVAFTPSGSMGGANGFMFVNSHLFSYGYASNAIVNFSVQREIISGQSNTTNCPAPQATGPNTVNGDIFVTNQGIILCDPSGNILIEGAVNYTQQPGQTVRFTMVEPADFDLQMKLNDSFSAQTTTQILTALFNKYGLYLSIGTFSGSATTHNIKFTGTLQDAIIQCCEWDNAEFYFTPDLVCYFQIQGYATSSGLTLSLANGNITGEVALNNVNNQYNSVQCYGTIVSGQPLSSFKTTGTSSSAGLHTITLYTNIANQGDLDSFATQALANRNTYFQQVTLHTAGLGLMQVGWTSTITYSAGPINISGTWILQAAIYDYVTGLCTCVFFNQIYYATADNNVAPLDQATSYVSQKVDNLAGQMGGAAYLNVGTTAGTVAAGNNIGASITWRDAAAWDYTLSTANSWTDLDVSAIVPAGKTVVILACNIEGANGSYQRLMFRPKGFTNFTTRIFYAVSTANGLDGTAIVLLDANRKLQYYLDGGQTGYALVVGWF